MIKVIKFEEDTDNQEFSHSDGVRFETEDGELRVLDKEDDEIAAYADGSWDTVVREEAPEPRHIVFHTMYPTVKDRHHTLNYWTPVQTAYSEKLRKFVDEFNAGLKTPSAAKEGEVWTAPNHSRMVKISQDTWAVLGRSRRDEITNLYRDGYLTKHRFRPEKKEG